MLNLILGGAISAGTSLISGISAAKRQKKAKREYDSNMSTLKNWYNNEMSGSYVDSSAAKNALNMLRKQNNRNNESMNNGWIRNNMTNEGRVAMSSRLNDSYSNSISDLAAMDPSYKNSIMDRYNNLSNRNYSIYRTKAEEGNGAMRYFSGMGQELGSSIMTAYGSGLFENKDKKKKTDNDTNANS